MNCIYYSLWENVSTMALYEHHSKEYREDLFSLYEHAKRISDRNEVCIEMIFEDLIYKNLTDY